MLIQLNQQIDYKLWNKFSNSQIFFRYEWMYVIQNTYHLEPCFVLCSVSDKFALIASFKTSKGYISLPFVSYSGFLSNDDEMLSQLKIYLKENKIDIDSRSLLLEEVQNGYVNPIVEINSFEEFWKNISSNTRNQFKKSEKSHFACEEEDNYQVFYRLYALGMRNLGTPCHGKSFFDQLIKYFDYKIFTIYHERQAIGSMFCLKDKDTLAVLYAYVLPEYSKEYANYFLYLSAIRWMSENNLKYLDMGRSTYGEGTFHFKSKFRPKMYGISSKVVYSKDKKLTLASSLWKHLPLPLANLIGPKVRKYLP